MNWSQGWHALFSFQRTRLGKGGTLLPAPKDCQALFGFHSNLLENHVLYRTGDCPCRVPSLYSACPFALFGVPSASMHASRLRPFLLPALALSLLAPWGLPFLAQASGTPANPAGSPPQESDSLENARALAAAG